MHVVYNKEQTYTVYTLFCIETISINKPDV